MTTLAGHHEFMAEVLSLAKEALVSGELPIASIVVVKESIVVRTSTSERRDRRFLVHAELAALQEAEKLGLSLEERRTATLYSNLEPCLMCMGACMSFFLGELVYSLESPADGAVRLAKSWTRKEEDLPGYILPKITSGVLRAETIKLFDRYANMHAADPMSRWAKTLAELE